MDNAQIVTEIRNRMGGQYAGLSDMTVTSLITPLIPKEGEPTEEFFTNTANWLRTLGGNFSHDVAQQVNQQVESKANEKLEAFKSAGWKPQSAEEVLKALGVEAGEGSPKTLEEIKGLFSTRSRNTEAEKKEEQTGLTAEDVKKLIHDAQNENPMVKALKEQIEKMNADNERMRNQALFDGIVKNVTDKADELNVSDTALWNHSVSVVSSSIDRKDLTDDKMLAAVKAKFEELTKVLRPAGTKPYGDTQNGGGKSILDQILADKAKSSKLKQEAIEKQRQNWK